MALPDAYLGSNLKSYFNQNYTAGTGTFVDDKAIAANLVQPTSGNRPTWNTSTAPSGRGLLSFPGGGSHQLSGGAIATGSLPTYGSNCWVDFCIVKPSTTGTAIDEQHVINYNGAELLALFWGVLYHLGANGDGVLGTGVARLIGVGNATTGVYTLYVNNVAQADTGSASSAIRAQWVDLKYVGNRNNGSQPLGGLLGCIGWAVASSFGSTEVAALDAAMDEWWTTAPGGGGITCALPAPLREEFGSSLTRSSGSVAFSFPTGQPGYDRSSVSAVPWLAAAMPAPSGEANALPISLVVALTAAMAPASAEERPGTAVGAPGSRSSALVGVGSSELVPAATVTKSSLSTLAPGPSSELGLSLTVAHGAVSAALSAALAEERGGIVTTVNGSAPAPIIVLLPAPLAEERSTSSALAPGATNALLAPRAGEELGGLVSAVKTTVAALAAPRAEEQATKIARELASVLVSLASSSASEHALGSPVQAFNLISLPAPLREERGGTFEATLGPPPPPPTAITFVVHASTVRRVVHGTSAVRSLFSDSGEIVARVTHTSNVGR